MYTYNWQHNFWKRRVKQEIYEVDKQIQFKKRVQSNEPLNRYPGKTDNFNFYQRGTADPNKIIQRPYKQHFNQPLDDKEFVDHIKKDFSFSNGFSQTIPKKRRTDRKDRVSHF